MFVVPDRLLQLPHRHKRIELDGVTIIESCHHELSDSGSIYIAQHEIIHVLSGQCVLRNGSTEVVIEKGETALAKRTSYCDYTKWGRAIGEDYESVLFFLNDAFVADFLAQNRIHVPDSQPLSSIVKLPKHPLITGFIHSLVPYFDSRLAYNPQLLRLKTTEFLLSLAETEPSLLAYFFRLSHPEKSDLVRVMEEHFTKNIPLEDFAYMSGRSLATFKRDFARIFNSTPHKWLKKKRLELARHLLENTAKQVSDVCLETGFEDVSHFSKSFREHFGFSPNTRKAKPQLA